MKKISLILFLCLIVFTLVISSSCFAGELVHIIKDSESWYEGIFEERASCVEEEHLFIELSREDWWDIAGVDKSTISDHWKEIGFSAQFCIKCRLISVSCNGNDWYKYIIMGNSPLRFKQ